MGKRKGFEPWFSDYLHEILGPNMIFLDAGAYFGHYVVLASPRVKRVVAIEPHPDNVKVLRETIRQVGLENVIVIEQALFSCETRGRLGRKNVFHVSSNGPLRATTLDALNLAPNVIKIDVEGAEYDVLIGGERTIKEYKPTLLIEIHDKKIEYFGYTSRQVHQLLINWDYKLTGVGRRSTSQFVIAE